MEFLPQPQPFGKLLKKLRRMARFSQTDLGYSASTVAAWEMGRRIPERATVLELIQALFVSDAVGNRLLELAGYQHLSEDEKDRFSNRGVQLLLPIFTQEQIDQMVLGDDMPSIVESTGRSVGSPTVILSSPTVENSVSQLQTQLSGLQDSVAALQVQLEEKGGSTGSGSDLDVFAQLDELKERVSGLQDTGKSLTARVVLPEAEEMEVRLVASANLERVDEYRGQTSEWWSWFSIFVGAVIGIGVNLVTGGTPSNEMWLLLAFFIALSVWAFVQWRRFKKKADSFRDRHILGLPRPVTTH